jgi:hypothetical protein
LTLHYRQHTAAHNAGLCLRVEQFNFLKSADKCYGLSLSLSGTASAAGTLGAIHQQLVKFSTKFLNLAEN